MEVLANGQHDPSLISQSKKKNGKNRIKSGKKEILPNNSQTISIDLNGADGRKDDPAKKNNCVISIDTKE